jgi:hypothetical protein
VGYLDYDMAQYFAAQRLIHGLKKLVSIRKRKASLAISKGVIVQQRATESSNGEESEADTEVAHQTAAVAIGFLQRSSTVYGLGSSNRAGQRKKKSSIAEEMGLLELHDDLTLMGAISHPDLRLMLLRFDDLEEPTKLNTRFLCDCLSWRVRLSAPGSAYCSFNRLVSLQADPERSREEALKIVSTYMSVKGVVSISANQCALLAEGIKTKIAEHVEDGLDLPSNLFDASFRIVYQRLDAVLYVLYLRSGTLSRCHRANVAYARYVGGHHSLTGRNSRDMLESNSPLIPLLWKMINCTVVI